MTCPLLEQYCSAMPQRNDSPFDSGNQQNETVRLLTAVMREPCDRNRTRRRVYEALNLFLNMLSRSIAHVVAEALKNKPIPYLIRPADLSDPLHLEHWIRIADVRLHDIHIDLALFALGSEEVRRGSKQMAASAHQRLKDETEELLCAVLVVERYYQDPRDHYAQQIGAILFNCCWQRGSTDFALQQGQRLLELRIP